MLILDLRLKSQKRKAPSELGNTRKIPRLSWETSAEGTEFPILLPQSEKDQIVVNSGELPTMLR
jgi:hypothetical protein